MIKLNELIVNFNSLLNEFSQKSIEPKKNYTFGGLVYSSLVEKDTILINIIQLLEDNKSEFNDLFVKAFKIVTREDIKIEEKSKAENFGRSTLIEDIKIQKFEEDLKKITSIDIFLCKTRSEYSDSSHSYHFDANLNNFTLTEAEIELSRVVDIFYQSHKINAKKNISIHNFEMSEATRKEVMKIYPNENVFDRYNLFHFDTSRHILGYKELNFIRDINNYSKTMCVRVSSPILEFLDKNLKNNTITELALQITDVIEGPTPAFEDVQKGKYFEWKLGNLPASTVLFDIKSNNYEKKLVVLVDKSATKTSVTFECLIDDLNISDNLEVLTNLVHLEVTNKDGTEVISHIDHEYIVYSSEEYDMHLKDFSAKGSKKIKTFKLDNATIPFNSRFNGVPSLFFILMGCMEYNHDLIREYFSKVLDTNN